MPYQNIWEPYGLYRQFNGMITGEEILESNFDLQADRRFQKIKYVINDFTAVNGHSIQASDAAAYAKTDEIISHDKGYFKIALVVTMSSLVGLANSYREQIKGMKFECEIFHLLDDARAWVNEGIQK